MKQIMTREYYFTNNIYEELDIYFTNCTLAELIYAALVPKTKVTEGSSKENES